MKQYDKVINRKTKKIASVAQVNGDHMIIKYLKNGKLHGPLYDVKTKNFVEYPEEGNRKLAAIIVPSLPRLTKADQERDKIRSEWESESRQGA